MGGSIGKTGEYFFGSSILAIPDLFGDDGAGFILLYETPRRRELEEILHKTWQQIYKHGTVRYRSNVVSLRENADKEDCLKYLFEPMANHNSDEDIKDYADFLITEPPSDPD